MKKLLELLGLRKESRNVPLAVLEPVCNLSLKNEYFNSLALRLADYARLSNDEFKRADNALQARLGIRVIYCPNKIIFS